MVRTIDGKPCVTAAVAARELDTTITRVLMLLRSNDLKGTQLAGEWYVESDSVACAKAHGTDMKAAKGCTSYCSAGGCGCK